ncbi:MAG: cell division protein FtsL [Hydrogenibacillus sp.]|nr:cell division protein FtsL [Hydrogenibacillus sp.]
MARYYVEGNAAIKTSGAVLAPGLPRTPAVPRAASRDAAKGAGLLPGEKVLYLSYVVLSALVFLFVLSRFAEAVALNDRLTGVEREIRALEKENARLSVEVVELGRPSRIIAIAREHGLRPRPDGVKVITTVQSAALSPGGERSPAAAYESEVDGRP